VTRRKQKIISPLQAGIDSMSPTGGHGRAAQRICESIRAMSHRRWLPCSTDMAPQTGVGHAPPPVPLAYGRCRRPGQPTALSGALRDRQDRPDRAWQHLRAAPNPARPCRPLPSPPRRVLPSPGPHPPAAAAAAAASAGRWEAGLRRRGEARQDDGGRRQGGRAGPGPGTQADQYELKQ
jgi:hypothetical protein